MAIDRDLDFTGKTVLVTGAGRGIGRHIILEFAARGANVIINAPSHEEEARAVEREARELGAQTLVVMGAAGDAVTVEEMKRRAEETFGRVDISVTNAVRRARQTFFEASDEDRHHLVDEHLTASWYLAKALVPGMIEAGWGRIIHINGTDAAGRAGSPHTVAADALRAFTKSLATDLGEYGITVNEVDPGATDTTHDDETRPDVPPDFAQRAREMIPIGRRPRPDELAFAVAFLCSDRAGAITGSTLCVDGGQGVLR